LALRKLSRRTGICSVPSAILAAKERRRRSKVMNEINPEAIRARIMEVALREAELPEPVAHDVAFHMTDWLDDLKAYGRFCTDPGKLSDDEVNKMLIAFLIHVPNHLAAASKLYTDFPVADIFGVGATSEDTEY
jgi:hypothetical protein